jgi:tetratricopeptide (TPR) repeat protein
VPEEDRKKAKVFFDRANTVANTGQYDYAIELYIQGLNLDPESVEAHQTLRDISLRRKASGGKPMGMLEKMKLKTTRDDRGAMLAAEKMLAFDPGNTDHMIAIMQAAQKGGYYDTAMWIGPITLKANVDGKNELNKFLTLKEIYKALKQWKRATEACQYAVAAKPEDMDLQRELKDLSARQTMDEGNYEGGGSFRDSMRDKEGQQKLIDADKDIRSDDAMGRMIADAENELRADPEEPGKLMKLVDLLVKTENPTQENRAIDLLQQAYDRTKQFRFRLAIGQIRIRQMSRMERSLRERIAKNPSDRELIKEYNAFQRDRWEMELNEYTLWAENYPTQLDYKYNMARRMFDLERYSEAIPVFQNAVQDPKFRTEATVMLGRSFLEAGFVDEAVDTLKGIIDQYQIKGDEKSIEMTYWYARALEEKDDKPVASKAYSQVAMWNFNYRDVQQRIKKIRAAK